MKKIYNRMECKCTIETADLITNNKNQNICPEHRQIVIDRFTSCEYPGCKEIRYMKKSGVIPKFCLVHQKKRDADRKRAFSKKYYHKNKETINQKNKRTKIPRRKMYDNLSDESKLDCSDRMICCDLYDKFDTIPCKPCKKYKKPKYRDDGLSTSRNYEPH